MACFSVFFCGGEVERPVLRALREFSPPAERELAFPKGRRGLVFQYPEAHPLARERA
jgi:hypothetical protein